MKNSKKKILPLAAWYIKYRRAQRGAVGGQGAFDDFSPFFTFVFFFLIGQVFFLACVCESVYCPLFYFFFCGTDRYFLLGWLWFFVEELAEILASLFVDANTRLKTRSYRSTLRIHFLFPVCCLLISMFVG